MSPSFHSLANKSKTAGCRKA